jgi:hypothetical protein
MKKIITASLLALAFLNTANADAHGYYRGGYHGGWHGGWVAPALIGGAIGYGLARPYYDPVYVSPPVVVEQQPIYINQQPAVTNPPPGYHWAEMVDPQTNVRKIVLVPN